MTMNNHSSDTPGKDDVTSSNRQSLAAMQRRSRHRQHANALATSALDSPMSSSSSSSRSTPPSSLLLTQSWISLPFPASSASSSSSPLIYDGHDLNSPPSPPPVTIYHGSTLDIVQRAIEIVSSVDFDPSRECQYHDHHCDCHCQSSSVDGRRANNNSDNNKRR